MVVRSIEVVPGLVEKRMVGEHIVVAGTAVGEEELVHPEEEGTGTTY